MKIILLFLMFSSLSNSLFANKTVNVYAWAGEIPSAIIQAFEKETGIKVNFATYDSNETMYTKLKASRRSIYDVIMPSGYFVERMKKQHLLTELNPENIKNMVHLEAKFKNATFDKGNHYSVPFVWGATGIFYNKHWISSPPKAWSGLWKNEWKNKLLLLDDSREVFSIALLSLGLNPNSQNPDEIKAAYLHLLDLVPNIRLFSSEGIQAIMIDEDANIGSVWNGDSFKAYQENKRIRFVYPEDGFVVWVDCLAIPRQPPHLQEAYQFIDFMLRPEVAEKVALLNGHAITNKTAKSRLPKEMARNKMIYPSAKTMQRAYFQQDVGEQAIRLYNFYWQKLKLAF